MNGPATIHKVKYILWIRSEYESLRVPVFYGTLETVAGQQFKFSTLGELKGLLYEICGWIDSLPPTNKVGEMDITCQEVGTARYDNKP
jgi:hypothetical protein